MLPALPTGIARMSGARPRSSQTSNAAGLLALEPERVDRVDERDRVVVLLGQGPDDPQRGVEVAVDRDDPGAGDLIAWRSLPIAILPAGRTTTTSSPWAAPYAAADADVFPVEAQMIARAPSSTAFATATTIPRSLNEPVGFWPSTLANRRSRPSRRPEAAERDERRRRPRRG